MVDSGQSQSFTRAGNLQLDANGNLVTQTGANVQGYAMNAATGLDRHVRHDVHQDPVNSGRSDRNFELCPRDESRFDGRHRNTVHNVDPGI